MNATLRALACALLGASLAAAEAPAPSRVVVLDNENLLEGEVTRVEDGYRIHRPVGGDVTLPAGRILAVVADRRAAFVIVAERANRRDADERLRLARWCSANGLPELAIAEARTAARMRPGFRAAEQFVLALEAIAKAAPPAPDPAVIQARAQAPAPDTVKDVPNLEYNSESFPLYASKVNAILLNTCGSCHGADAREFRLSRLGGRSGVTKNLMSALAQVNPTNPAASPLLVKAVTPHGTATEAPLKSRAHPAYLTLETWAYFARAPEGTPEPEGALAPPRPPEPQKLPDLGPARPTPPGQSEAFGRDSDSVPPKPVKTRADDPFDPAIFNGEVRPKK
jgi:hypothetical protein